MKSALTNLLLIALLQEMTFDQIIECIRKNPGMNLDALAARIGVSRRTTVRMIDRLKKQGRIRRKGGTRGVWEVLV